MKSNNKHSIAATANLREALKRLNDIEGGHHKQVLFVTNENQQLIGALTDGDVRRALISGKELNTAVPEVMFKDFRHFIEGQHNLLKLIKELKEEEIFLLPVIDKHKRLISIFDLKEVKSILPIDAVLMAGGEGKRLLPLTEKTPKPLLKVGDKPIISYNINRLLSYYVKRQYFTLNYLGNQIEKYVVENFQNRLDAHFIYEKEKLGTAGALRLIKDFEQDTILVMNADLLTTIDFEAFYLFFLEQKADMAVATIPYQVKVPYAIMDVKNNEVTNFREKPIYNYYSNAGIYLLKRDLIDLIPHNQFFDATDLMQAVMNNRKKLVSFPIRHYWLDIGKPDDFERANEDVKYLRIN